MEPIGAALQREDSVLEDEELLTDRGAFAVSMLDASAHSEALADADAVLEEPRRLVTVQAVRAGTGRRMTCSTPRHPTGAPPPCTPGCARTPPTAATRSPCTAWRLRSTRSTSWREQSPPAQRAPFAWPRGRSCFAAVEATAA